MTGKRMSEGEVEKTALKKRIIRQPAAPIAIGATLKLYLRRVRL